MDAHTNFDPHGFSRAAGVDIAAAGLAFASAARAAIVDARALATHQATMRTVADWRATVQGLVELLATQVNDNARLSVVIEQLRERVRIQELELQTLRGLL